MRVYDMDGHFFSSYNHEHRNLIVIRVKFVHRCWATQIPVIRLYRVSASPGRYEAVQYNTGVSIKGLLI